MQYKNTPLQARSKVVAANDTQYLHFQVDTVLSKQRLSKLNFVVPDHGKMMHLFIMRIPEMDAFAHLHPQPHASVSLCISCRWAVSHLGAGKAKWAGANGRL